MIENIKISMVFAVEGRPGGPGTIENIKIFKVVALGETRRHMKIKKSSNSSMIIMYAAEFAMHVHHMCNTCAIAQENNRTEKWPANLHRIGRNGKEPDENEWATAGLLRTPCGVDQEHSTFGVPTHAKGLEIYAFTMDQGPPVAAPPHCPHNENVGNV